MLTICQTLPYRPIPMLSMETGASLLSITHFYLTYKSFQNKISRRRFSGKFRAA